MIHVTPDEWATWRNNPVTRAFMNVVLEMREEGINELVSGVHSEDVGKTHLVIGKVNAFNSVLNVEFVEDTK